MNKASFTDLSLDEIQERLSSLETDKVALKRALEQKKQQSKKELAQEIKDLIISRGYEVSDIAEYLGPRKRGGARVKGGRTYVRYVDPENSRNVYVRGVLPGWMKDQMAAHGLNPKDKNDRETFKREHLQKTEAC